MTREGAVRTAPAPSSASRTSGGRRGSGRVDVRAWAGGIRFSAFTAIMLGLVVLAVFTLVPTVGTYLGQRQQIAALAHSVQVSEADVATLQQQKDRWNDPAYVTSQARERLYYVRPGEVVYLVDNDLPATAMPPTQARRERSGAGDPHRLDGAAGALGRRGGSGPDGGGAPGRARGLIQRSVSAPRYP